MLDEDKRRLQNTALGLDQDVRELNVELAAIEEDRPEVDLVQLARQMKISTTTAPAQRFLGVGSMNKEPVKQEPRPRNVANEAVLEGLAVVIPSWRGLYAATASIFRVYN